METATFMVFITLSTEAGELPDNDQVANLIAAQMTYDYLDDETGLTCLAVTVAGRSAS